MVVSPFFSKDSATFNNTGNKKNMEIARGPNFLSLTLGFKYEHLMGWFGS